MIGRKREQQELLATLERDEAQLVAVYGRRRVGKTYLVRETFKDGFFFQHTGLAHGSMAEQLAAFRDSLQRAGASVVPTLRSWREAFRALEGFIRESDKHDKKVIFIDEMPWMDTPKSKFVMWFEAFWIGLRDAGADVCLRGALRRWRALGAPGEDVL